MATESTTPARNPPQSRARRLAALTTKEGCQGKSKFFLEHQAMREKEGDKGLDPAMHSWRFTEQLPMPEGIWPAARKFSCYPRDESDKAEAAKWHRKQNRVNQEVERQHKRTEEEARRQLERFPPGKPVPDQKLQEELAREAPLSKDGESHVRNVQMAMRFINRKCTGSNYKLKEITAKCTIVDFGSTNCHYNFAAYSPTDGFQLFFAEVDVTLECIVLQCCTVGSGPYGSCMGCQSKGVLVIHPSRDKFFAGKERYCCDSEWC